MNYLDKYNDRDVKIEVFSKAAARSSIGDHAIIAWWMAGEAMEGELFTKELEGWKNPRDAPGARPMTDHELAEAYWCDMWVIM